MQQLQPGPARPVPTDGGRRRRRIAGGLAAVLSIGAFAVFLLTRGPATPRTQAGTVAELTVHLSGVAGNAGQIMAALCDRDSFLKRCAYMQTVAAAPSVTLQFHGVPPGRYAVMLFHDENANGQFDKSRSGMPLEGYGFSRNARGKFGPPSFDDAAIDLKPGAATIDVELAY